MSGDQNEYRHWRMEQEEGICRLTIDRADSGANSLSGEVLDELDRLLDGLGGTTLRAVIFRSGKKKGFIAGADIREFTTLEDQAAALRLIRRGQSVLSRIEALGPPTFALIHGFCLGGGLELALACRYRIASDDPATMLGFPEVRLGLHPGFGGTVRSIGLVGPLTAMKMMLTGNPLNARQALRIGLVDSVVPVSELERTALELLAAPPFPRLLPERERLAGQLPARADVARHLRRKAAAKADPRHYPAASALIDLWSGFGSDGSANYTAEAESIARLLVGSSARNLIRLFLLQERLKSLGRSAARAPDSVHLVGCGERGADIAAWCGLNGRRVTLQDRDGAALDRAIERAKLLFRRQLKAGSAVQDALDRLVPDPGGQGVASADLLIEATGGNLDDKRALYRQLEQRMRPDALLAGSSGIALEELAGSLARPERLIGLQFFSPVDRSQLVEVATLAGTDPDLAARARALVLAIRLLPLDVAGSPGFLVHRILLPYLLEAISLVEEGVAPDEVDRAATEFGMSVGPLRTADRIGLDSCLALAGSLSCHFPLEVPALLERFVAAGRLGCKSGIGLYRYPDPGKSGAGPSGTVPAAEIGERILLRLLNQAVACRGERVVQDDDLLDAGMVFGGGFAPFRGGPLQHILAVGPAALWERLDRFRRRFGSRFTPHPGWQDLIDRQRRATGGGKP
jgi:3-hydroxyacyl-CoA dehydrogenase/enoyl-CoA hydratase/3-hydroxybutyryl-CoA epimerase